MSTAGITPLSKSAGLTEQGEAESLNVIDPTTWVDQFGDALFGYAMRRVQNRDLAEELVQNTFLAALKARSRFRRESTVSTWLFAILRNQIADHYRGVGSNKEVQLCDRLEECASEGDSLNLTSNGSSSARDWKSDPAKIVEDREFWEAFNHCIEHLPNKLLEVYILREVNGYSLAEIREMLNLSSSNLSMRLSRCRLAIRNCLEKTWFRG